MKTVVMLSNHHAHLTAEASQALFGDRGITFAHYLAEEGGPWSSNEFVEVRGPKGALGKFRVLGPLRPYTQVELLRSDCFKLGVDPPVRNSGKLDGAVELTLAGPCGEYTARCGILAWRHIHVDKETLLDMGRQYGEFVTVRTAGDRALDFKNVALVPGGKGLLMHLDTEEGNAAGCRNGDMLEVIL